MADRPPTGTTRAFTTTRRDRGCAASIATRDRASRELLPERYALFAPGLRDCTPEAVSPYRVHDRCIESFRVGRVLLAGDAAHVVNPIGGLGLTGGLLDAVPLSAALIAVIHGQRGPEVLDAWAHERRRVFLEVTAPTAKENRRRVSERVDESAQEDYRHNQDRCEQQRPKKAAVLPHQSFFIIADNFHGLLSETLLKLTGADYRKPSSRAEEVRIAQTVRRRTLRG